MNRIKITGFWASRSQIRNLNLTFKERVKEWWHDLVFRVVMLTLDFSFWKSRSLRWFRNLRAKFRLGGGVSRSGGFEDELERTMRDFAKDNLGINVGEGAFAG